MWEMFSQFFEGQSALANFLQIGGGAVGFLLVVCWLSGEAEGGLYCAFSPAERAPCHYGWLGRNFNHRQQNPCGLLWSMIVPTTTHWSPCADSVIR